MERVNAKLGAVKDGYGLTFQLLRSRLMEIDSNEDVANTSLSDQIAMAQVLATVLLAEAIREGYR